jgi:triosephosphate isomerase
MRQTTFIGSWKTYKTTANEVREFFEQLPAYASQFNAGHQVVLCPSFVHMDMVGQALPPYMQLGAQDCSEFVKGPHTGDTTAEQLKALNVKYCICGHVERRKAGETDAQINGKVKRCLENGIKPIVCFGETLQEYDNNQTRIIIERQMRDTLLGIKNLEDVILCYMPIWAIGTGFYTSGEYSNIIADFIRRTAVKLTGNPMSANCTIVFGGQITSTNVGEYMECPEIDGVIFAIAALNPKDFAGFASTKFNIKKYQRIDQTPTEKK